MPPLFFPFLTPGTDSPSKNLRGPKFLEWQLKNLKRYAILNKKDDFFDIFIKTLYLDDPNLKEQAIR